jgi:aminopeptidase
MTTLEIMHDPRLANLANLLVRYSTEVKPGDLVSLSGPPLAEPLVVALYRSVLREGGHPVVVMSPEECLEELYRQGTSEQLAFVSPLEQEEVESANVAIHVLATRNTQALATIDPARAAARSKGRRDLMSRFLDRSARGELRWVVTQFPCAAAAQDAEMSLGEYEDFVFAAALADVSNPAAKWREVSERQAKLAAFLTTIEELHLTTPAGTDLRLGVRGRVWINCDGKQNVPDGEVFTAPHEDAVDGVVLFDFPAVHRGRQVEGVRLTFRAGRIVAASAQKGEEYLIQMLDQDAGARTLGEIGIGCNYSITRHTRNTLFDEKIGGTFHLAPGSAYPESGGTNKSALHWDMVADLRKGGRIEADGQVISENGRFLKLDWPQPV